MLCNPAIVKICSTAAFCQFPAMSRHRTGRPDDRRHAKHGSQDPGGRSRSGASRFAARLTGTQGVNRGARQRMPPSPDGKVSSPNGRQGLRIQGWRWRRWKRLRIQSARRARGQLRPAPPEAARIYGTPPARATRFYVISVASGSVTRAVAGRPSTSVISRRCCSIAAGGRITRASISPPGHSAITPVSDCLRLIDP